MTAAVSLYPVPYSTPMTDDELEELWHSALGQEIAVHRKREGLSQPEAEEATGVSSSMISKIERGKGTKLGTYLKICRALGIDFTSLIASAELVVKARQISIAAPTDEDPSGS